MIETTFECHITVNDPEIGYYAKRIVKGEDLYQFTMEFATAMFNMTGEAMAYRKAIERDNMEEQGELPF